MKKGYSKEQLIKKADKVVSLSDLPEGSLLSRIANAHIKSNGFYTYQDSNSKNIFVC